MRDSWCVRLTCFRIGSVRDRTLRHAADLDPNLGYFSPMRQARLPCRCEGIPNTTSLYFRSFLDMALYRVIMECLYVWYKDDQTKNTSSIRLVS